MPSNVSSAIEEATVASKISWRCALVGTAMLCTSSWMACPTAAWAQQSGPQQPPPQRDDPATSGAGPTSGAPGQLNYDPPKGGSVTTDSKGVTTTQPKSDVPKSAAPKSDAPKAGDVPIDYGNDSVGTTPRK